MMIVLCWRLCAYMLTLWRAYAAPPLGGRRRAAALACHATICCDQRLPRRVPRLFFAANLPALPLRAARARAARNAAFPLLSSATSLPPVARTPRAAHLAARRNAACCAAFTTRRSHALLCAHNITAGYGGCLCCVYALPPPLSRRRQPRARADATRYMPSPKQRRAYMPALCRRLPYWFHLSLLARHFAAQRAARCARRARGWRARAPYGGAPVYRRSTERTWNGQRAARISIFSWPGGRGGMATLTAWLVNAPRRCCETGGRRNKTQRRQAAS